MAESPEMRLPHENYVFLFGHEKTWEDVVISDDLTEGQRWQLRNLLHEYSDVFSGKPNLTSVAMHKINTVDSPPIRCSPYKIPHKLEEEVNKEIEKMHNMGGTCCHCSQARWYNKRKINCVTKMDAYPIPSMERVIEKITSAKYISTIDLTKGYWERFPWRPLQLRSPHLLLLKSCMSF